MQPSMGSPICVPVTQIRGAEDRKLLGRWKLNTLLVLCGSDVSRCFHSPYLMLSQVPVPMLGRCSVPSPPLTPPFMGLFLPFSLLYSPRAFPGTLQPSSL